MEHAAKMTLPLSQEARDKEHHKARYDAVEGYLYEMGSRGYLWGDFVLSWTPTMCSAYAYLSHPDVLSLPTLLSLEERAMKELFGLFGMLPAWEILDQPLDSWRPEVGKEEFFYLFTHAFDRTSPVCLGSSGAPLPLFFLPLEFSECHRLQRWMSSYQDHERVWLCSGTLEIPSYKELVEPESALSCEGRALCELIETRTGTPVYYYLNRYWGRRKGEEERLCPRCGKKWRRGAFWERKGFLPFPFRCDPCRLVSHLADSTEDERHARLGEYRPKRFFDAKKD